MSSALKYAAVGTAVVGTAVLLSAPFLDPAGRRGVVIAALVALPIQIGSFALLVRYRSRVKGFLAAWVGGAALRMLTIGVVAVVVIRSGSEATVPTLLALASFFFGLLLLEPIYFKAAQGETG